MAASSDHAPVWLFSFVDLAFLLLIAMTQLGRHPEAPDLGDLVVPRVHGDEAAALPSEAAGRWQLRVEPRSAPDAPAFALARPSSGAEPERLAADALRQRLAALHAEGAERPLLAPDADSRSEDLLDAVALLEEAWPGRRRAAVLPWTDPR